ncbi:amidohydrolase family protein [Curtobacterium pusillum]|uniref:metal-dependent hydrolase family protein n=1 Tax=Curtobacterium pusillum TaxID=69373 RepID=UPI0011A418CE|nr:amidohydrolase family protein [Curtobacterium pusillum]
MPAPLALTGADVVVGDAEGSILRGRTVLVDQGGRIEAVTDGSVAVAPGSRRVVDGRGAWVVPGLINAHAHLFSDGRPLPAILTSERAERVVSAVFHSPVGAAVARRRTRTNVTTQLHSGVTTLRSLGDVRYEAVQVRDAVEAGRYPGPRMLVSGPLMAVSGGHGAPTIALVGDSPWDFRKHVRVSLRHGVTAIKIAATGGVTDARAVGEAGRPQMTVEEMTAICDEAHNAGVLVAAHAQSPEGVLAALQAGVDTIEHGSALTNEIVDLFHENPKALAGRSALVPTLQAALPLVRLDRAVTGVSAIVHANAEMILDAMLAGIRTALENDVLLGMGTDSALTYVTHYNTWRELDLLNRYGGLTIAQAVHAATQTNARILGLGERTGRIEPGFDADLLVVDGNPLEDLRALSRPRMVVARGVLIDAPTVQRFDDIDERLDTL